MAALSLAWGCDMQPEKFIRLVELAIQNLEQSDVDSAIVTLMVIRSVYLAEKKPRLCS